MQCHSIRVPQNHVLTLVANLGQGKLRLIPVAYILSVHRVQLFTRTVPTFLQSILLGQMTAMTDWSSLGNRWNELSLHVRLLSFLYCI